MTETLPAVTAAREALAREHQAVEDVDIATGVRPEVSHLARPLRDLLAVVERLTAPPSDEDLWDFADTLLDAWNIEDENPPSLTEDFRDRFVARFGSDAVAASGRRHLPTETEWEYGLYEEDPHRERERPHRAYNGAHLVSDNRDHVETQWRRGHPSIKFVRRRKAGPWEVCDEQ